MKRAKVMLTAIAVLAVVGGALAFKAKSLANVYCKSSTNVCASIAYTTLRPNPVTPTTSDPCPDETIFYTDTQCNTTFIETQNTVFETAL